MFIESLYAKLHGLICTNANINYEGSITLDRKWCEECGILQNQKVDVVNVTTGARITTYVIFGDYGNNDVCLNGAAARLFSKGDKVIVICYASFTIEEHKGFIPKIMFFKYDSNDKLIDCYLKDESPNTLVFRV
jgi:aspartate 1-decarboxylase